MRLPHLLSILIFCLATCALADEVEVAVDAARDRGAQVAAEVLGMEAGVFACVVVEAKGEVTTRRLGRPILRASKQHDGLYALLGPAGERYATVVTGQADSPRVVTEPGTPIRLQVSFPEDGAMRLAAYDPGSGFVEAFTVGEQGVTPISAEAYRQQLAEAAASGAAFRSILESLRDDAVAPPPHP